MSQLALGKFDFSTMNRPIMCKLKPKILGKPMGIKYLLKNESEVQNITEKQMRLAALRHIIFDVLA